MEREEHNIKFLAEKVEMLNAECVRHNKQTRYLLAIDFIKNTENHSYYFTKFDKDKLKNLFTDPVMKDLIFRLEYSFNHNKSITTINNSYNLRVRLIETSIHFYKKYE